MTDEKINGHRLLDGHLIRQCRNWQAPGGIVSPLAFMFEQGKSTLSFSWLEKICVDAKVSIDYDSAIMELEKSPPLKPVPGFMWAILSAKEIKSSVKDITGEPPQMKLEETDNDPSHVVVWDWKLRSKQIRKKVAQELASKLTEYNTRHWPVTPQDQDPLR